MTRRPFLLNYMLWRKWFASFHLPDRSSADVWFIVFHIQKSNLIIILEVQSQLCFWPNVWIRLSNKISCWFLLCFLYFVPINWSGFVLVFLFYFCFASLTYSLQFFLIGHLELRFSLSIFPMCLRSFIMVFVLIFRSSKFFFLLIASLIHSSLNNYNPYPWVCFLLKVFFCCLFCLIALCSNRP